MIDPETLAHFGTSNQQLRVVFSQPIGGELTEIAQQAFDRETRDIEKKREAPFTTAELKKRKKDFLDRLNDSRKCFEDRLRSRIQDGRTWNFSTYRFFMAADMAWNAPPITQEQVPIMAWAMGKISLKECYAEVKSACDTESEARKYFKFDKGKLTAVNEERLTDISINLVRPYLRRSVAALSNKYNDLSPFLKYQPRVRSLVGKLRGDLISQRVDVMSDQFGYEHLHTQMARGMFLHSWSVALKETDWTIEKQMSRVEDESKEGGFSFKPRITREGVRYVAPHPTRVFYDQGAPLSRLNYDDGPQHIGYWDIVRYQDIAHDPAYFNRDTIPFTTSANSAINRYSAFFNYYYDKSIKVKTAGSSNAAEGVQRDNVKAFFSTDKADEPLWLTHYYEKLVPKDHGLGKYDYPVWIHVVVAGDDTVVYAEWLHSSRPGFVYSYDEADNQVLSVSKALDILPYQETVTNLFSQLLYLMRLQSLLLLIVDADIVPKAIREQIKNLVEGNKLLGGTHIIEKTFQEESVWEQTYTQKKPLEIVQANVSNVINELMKGISSTIGMLEKNMMMSPNEMGAFNERETSASEVVEVANTSNALNGFKSEGVDEGRQALKTICYESYIAKGSPEVKLTVQERYPDEVIKAAGFKVEPLADGYELENDAHFLTGTKTSLIHEYTFNSRDGTERTVSTESAKVIMELMRYILSSEIALKAFVETYGMEQITASISEVFRLAGSPLTLKMPAAFSDRKLLDSMADKEKEDAVKQALQQIARQLQQVQQAIAQGDGRITQLEEIAQEFLSTMGAGPPPPAAPPGPAAPPPQAPAMQGAP